jgi:NADPH:quinone reductase-like Zn-dependent oxidoreductase
MKASVRLAYGPPSVLRIENIDKPTPKPRELLIKVHATTVNRTDLAVLSGRPLIFRLFAGFPSPRFASTGTDFAGTVESVGSAVVHFKPGDRVFGFNDHGLGSHAEYFTLSEDQPVMIIPNQVSFEDAAASIEGAHYAYNFISKVRLKEGDNVLVNGVTGAIGSAAIQILRQYKVRVTAVCGSDHLAWAKSMGAIKTYDYTREDFTTNNEKYAFIFDAVGKSSYSRCKHLLEERGVYISSEFGDGGENLFWAAVTPMLGGRKVIFPIPVDIKRSLSLVRSLFEKGDFKPLIDRVYPLEALAEAFVHVASGKKLGNVVVKMAVH